MKKTNVFATKGQLKIIKDSVNTPYIMIGESFPDNPAEICHKFALAQGLPEISGYYGINLETGEFIECD